MEANEFVKRYGIDEAKRVLDYCEEQGIGLCVGSKTVSINDLERLIESYDLIEEHGGLDVVKSDIKQHTSYVVNLFGNIEIYNKQ